MPIARGPGTYCQPEKVHNKPHSGVGVCGLSGGIYINESVHSLRETVEDKARCEANVGLPTGDNEGSSTLCQEKAVATLRGITLAPLHYQALQMLMNSVLPLNYTQEEVNKKYETVLTLTAACKADLTWWV